MTDKTYNIVVTGELLEGTSYDTAVLAFAAAFKMDADKANAVLQKAPKIIKAGVSDSKAKSYLNAFKKIGLDARAELVEPKQEAVSPPAATEASPSKENVSVPADREKTPLATEEPESAGVSEAGVEAAPGHDQSASFIPQNPPGFDFRIDGKPDYSFLTVQIPADKTLKVEASAMATMDTSVKMKTKMRGGLGRLLTGENLFLNEFTAENIPGEIGIAPGTPGDLTHQYLDGNTIFLQNSAYVASTEGVNVETKWQGLVKGFFSGESLFLIRCSGQGDLWFNTYGAIIEIDVNGGYVVDTGNIVAFTEGLEYKISKVGGYKSLFFSGEGFVCRFSGSGKVWIQTRSAQAFTQWAHWYRPVKGK